MNRISTWILVAVMGLVSVESGLAAEGCSLRDPVNNPSGKQCACGDDLTIKVRRTRTCGATNDHAVANAEITIPRPVAMSTCEETKTYPLLHPVSNECTNTICPNCHQIVEINDVTVTFSRSPSVCGCAAGTCSAGTPSGGTPCSVNEKWLLGRNTRGVSAGDIALHVEGVTPVAATPASLRCEGVVADVEEVRDAGDTNYLRQVLAPECLVDIVTNSAFRYTMNYYRIKDVLPLPDTNTGYYVVSSQAQAFVSIIVENPAASTNDCDTLWVVNSRGAYAVTNIWEWADTANGREWRVTSGGLRKETLERTTNGTDRVDVRTVMDTDGHVASKVRTTSRLSRYGYIPIETVNDPDGQALTEATVLFTDEGEAGRYGREKQTVHADGSWIRRDYNTNGWKTVEITPWLNAATNAAESESRVTLYDYTSVDANDLGDLLGYMSKPRTVTEKVGDKVTAKTYHAYYQNDGGERVEIEERCSDLSASYGASSNQRTVRIFNPPSDNDWEVYRADKINRITYPDGRVDSTSYERGIVVTNADPGQYTFVATATGECTRISVVHGTVTSSNGVAMKTTKDVTVQSVYGYVLMTETYVYTGSGFERVTWVVNTLDEDGHTVVVRRSDGTQTDTSWACCGKDKETDGLGGVHNYSYDALKRVTFEEKEGITAGEYPAQANVFTEYTYDAAGRKLTQTVRGVNLNLVTSNQYDLLGRMVSSTDPAGITTQYLYEGLTNTTIRGGATNVTVRFRDGNTCCALENGVVKFSYTYGVNDDGTRWTKVYTGSQGTNSPAWTKSTTDLLGRTISEEKPGFGGTVLTSTSVYNSQGRLIKTTRTSAPDTLYEYDELGNQIRSGSDVNGNGTLDLAGPDRINASDTSYQSDSSGNWWQIRTSILYVGDNSATPTTNSIQKTRLTGLGSSSALGALSSELISIDLLGNQTISRTYVDRSARTVTQTVTSPDSTNAATQVTVNGLMVASTSKTGIPTTFSYDTLMRSISQIGPRTASYTHYNALGQVDSTTDAASNTTTFAYDALGRRTQVTDALSNTTYTAYDNQGRVLATWGATYPVAYDYDDSGRMTAMYTYRGTTPPASYSAITNLISEMDQTRWLYDAATGLLTNKLYADNKGPSYTYTSDGKLATRTWARGVVTTYTYDPFGQLSSVSYNDNTPAVSFAYDRLGRQTTITDGAGTRTFTYNDALQLASEQSQISNQQFEITRQYDAYGRSIGFDAGTNYSVRYAYDQVGRFTAVSSTVMSVSSVATRYSYIPGSDLLSGWEISSGGTSSVSSTRSYEDTRNLITQVKNTFGSTLISQYDYVNDPIGRRTSVGMTGDAFSDLGASHNKYAYNVRSELEQAKRYAGTNLSSTANAIDGQAYLYGYDLIGNRTETYIGDMLNGSKHTYTANSLNQYTQKTVPAKARIMGAAASDATVTVNNQTTTRYGQYFQSYLDISNSSSAAYPLINIVGAKKNSGTNDSDVVTTATGHVFVAQTPEQFSYDDDGNLTQDGRWSYTWDAENRLIGMETLTNLPSSVPRMNLTFAYDYMSRRVSKTISAFESEIWNQKSQIRFAYDGWNLISEISYLPSQMQTNVSSFVWGLDLSGTLQGAGGIGGLLSSCSSASNASHLAFYLFDANGNVGQLVSTNGSILARYEYDPYGKLIKDVAEVSIRINPFRYSTKYADSETGFLYYGHRYYQPETGRWSSRDPIGGKGFLSHNRKTIRRKGKLVAEEPNLYLFVKNRTADELDVLGLLDSRTEAGLATLWPDFANEARWIMLGANTLLAPKCKCAKITSALRTIAQQNGIPDANTRARGATSYHVWGLAFDFTVFKLPPGDTNCEHAREPVQTIEDYDLVGSIVVDNEDVTWGGNFRSFQDKSHFEYNLSAIDGLDEFDNIRELAAAYDEYAAMFAPREAPPPPEFLLELLEN